MNPNSRALTTLLDPTASDSSRFEAVTQVIAYVDSAGKGMAEAKGALLRSLASKVADEIGLGDIALRSEWRRIEFPEPSALTIREALTAANLLYERTEHASARAYYERVRTSGEITPQALMLAAYNLELLARQTGDCESLEEARALLTEENVRRIDPNDSLRAERLHALGHIATAEAVVTGDLAGVKASEAVELLRLAADADPSYTSCYTSVFSELGDFLRTIDESLNVIQSWETDASRPPPDSTRVVQLEVLFYLGHAYTCVGEFERGLMCFRGFETSVQPAASDPYSREPIDHARLFQVRTELKRSLLSEVRLDDLEGWTAILRQLSFRSRSAKPVGDECDLNVKVLNFMTHVRAALDGDDARLSLAYQEAPDLLAAVANGRRVRDDQPVTLVAQGDIGDALSIAARNWPLVAVGSAADLDSRLGDAYVLSALGRDPQHAALLSRARGHGVVRVTLEGEPQNVPTDFVVPGLSEIQPRLLLGTALAAARSFLLDDVYVFSIVPCNRSPALVFQQPSYALDGLVS